MSKFAPYSFSKINSFLSCPRKFKYSYIDKIKVKQEQYHLIRGKYIHHLLECYRNPLKDSIKPHKQKIEDESVKEYKLLTATFIASPTGQKYINQDCIGREIELAFDHKLSMCGYWDESCLFRGSIDRLNRINDSILCAVDWKTGKYDPKRPPNNQLKFYALWCFMEYPEIKTVDCHYVYIETGNVTEYTYTRDDIKSLMKELLLKIKRIEKSRCFIKNQTVLCEYCDFYKCGKCKG